MLKGKTRVTRKELADEAGCAPQNISYYIRKGKIVREGVNILRYDEGVQALVEKIRRSKLRVAKRKMRAD